MHTWFRWLVCCCVCLLLACSTVRHLSTPVEANSCQAREWDVGTGSPKELAALGPEFRGRSPWFPRPTPSGTPASILAFTQDVERIGVLVTPGSCQTFRIVDYCEGTSQQSRTETSGSVPCVDGHRVEGEGQLTIAFNNRQKTFPIRPGEPVVFAQEELGVNLRTLRTNGNSHPAVDLSFEFDRGEVWKGVAKLDVFDGVTKQSIQDLVRAGGLERSVVPALESLPPSDKTAEFIDSLGDDRVAAARTQTSGMTSPVRAFYVLHRHLFEKGLPRDHDVAAVLAPSALASLEEAAKAPSSENFGSALALLRFLEAHSLESSQSANVFENAYGPLVANGTLSEASVEKFAQWQPRSPFVEEAFAREQAEEEVARKEAEKRAREAEAREKKEEAAERAQCVARCDHRCMDWRYANKALCRQGCRNYECDQNYCVGACQADCSTIDKAGQPGCVSACTRGRCGQ